MPQLSAHQSAATTKLLLIGDSGGGKTGALASLAGAGYNLRVIDVDNGLDVLRNLLSDPSSKYPKDAIERVRYETVTDKLEKVGDSLRPKKATVWPRVIGLLSNWVDSSSGEVLGPISSWGPKDVLVIDSLTMLSDAALNYVLGLNGRLGQRPQLQDWGQAQDMIEGLLQMLYDEGVRCNVIVASHITYVGGEDGTGPQRGYPNTLGKKLPPKVGRYFNNALGVKSVGQGANLRRVILTNTTGLIDLKNTAPLRVKAEYPIESGLADYFAAVRS